MFEVGDKVRYVPNEDSPRNASTDGEYIAAEVRVGTVFSVSEVNVAYPYRVTFDDLDGWLGFSEAELVKVA